MATEVADDEALADLEILGTNPGLSRGPAWNEFAIPYAAEFGNEAPDTFAAASYDAVVMVGLAAATIPADVVPTGLALSAGLQRLSGGAQSFHPGELRAAATALAEDASASIDYSGASGPLDLDPATGQAPADVALYAIAGGALTPLVLDGGAVHPLCD